MEAKKTLAEKLTSRYHGDSEGNAARADWETRFSKKDLNAAELPEISLSALPVNATILILTSFAFQKAFNLKKSNGELRKQFITSGSVQLNGEKQTDPTSSITLAAGDILKLSKKHAVRFV